MGYLHWKVHIKAEAYGCLGSIYEEVRNYPERAIEYYQKALESEVVGRMPDGTFWYIVHVYP